MKRLKWLQTLRLLSLGLVSVAGSLSTSVAQGGPLWTPSPGTTWQIQFTGLPVDQSFDVQMYDIDMFDNDASVVAALHAQGRKVICYINAGAWENWRPDADQFPPEVLGNDYAGWPGEKWLDIRRIDILGPIMRNRLDQCKAKGFDGVDPDNIDGYTNNTGFPLTYQDQLTYNIWLANEAHTRGLSIGLKNDPDQVADLLPYFEWALVESCFYYGWCNQMTPFIQAGKAVFAIEYTETGMTTSQFCPQANAMNFSGILKHLDLDAWQQSCRTAARFRVERSTGNVFTDGVFFPSGADLAERIDVSEPVEPGDVVELDPDRPKHYRRSRTPYSPLLAGVISTQPGLILGTQHQDREGRALLALLGRVPVKATAENGPIRPGDPLTSASKPGYAMRCATPGECEGAILGKALSSLEQGEGVILMLVMAR